MFAVFNWKKQTFLILRLRLYGTIIVIDKTENNIEDMEERNGFCAGRSYINAKIINK